MEYSYSGAKTAKPRPSVFSVTSLLAPDPKSQSGGSRRGNEEGPNTSGTLPRPPHPFFYPGLTLDMLNKSRSNQQQAAATAAAAALAAAAASQQQNIFPFPG